MYSYSNSFDAFKQIIRQEKFVGLYRAYGATILAFGPFVGLNLTLFERVKEYFKGKNESFGFIKGFFSALLTGMTFSDLPKRNHCGVNDKSFWGSQSSNASSTSPKIKWFDHWHKTWALWIQKCFSWNLFYLKKFGNFFFFGGFYLFFFF